MHYLVDLDNTLLNTFFKDETGQTHFYWAQNFEKDFGASKDIISDLFKLDFLTAIQQTKDVNHFVDSWIQKYHLNTTADDFLEYWLSRDANLNSNVMKWIEEQKKNGHLFYIASNQPYIRMDYIWNKFPQWHCIFTDVFTSSKLNIAKPHPKFFHLCQQKIGTPFEKMCLIDDNLDNIKTAQSLGMKTIAFQDETSFINPIE